MEQVDEPRRGTRFLEGRTVALTGASRGLGRAFAEALVAEGARVALIARASEKLTSVAETLGDSAVCVPCDVSDPGSVRDAFGVIGECFGGSLDVLINNAGVSLLGRVENLSDDAVRTEIGINLMGPIFTAREAIPMLRRSGRGDIVNISSESVKLPWPYLTVYAATKAALEAFTAGLRSELRADLIRVTVLRSGFVSGGELARNWDAGDLTDFYRVAGETGHLGLAGKTGAPSEAMAKALVGVLALPREIDVDLIEVRPTAG